MTIAALIVAGILVIVAAFIRASGASLVRTSRLDALRDAAEGDSRAETVADLLEDRPRLQPSLAIFHLLLLVAASLLAGWAATRTYSGVGLAVALIAVGLIVMLVGDLIPRSIGRARPRTLAYRFAWMLKPAVALGSATADLVEIDDDDDDEEEPADDDDEDERELISSVIELSDTIVREVMTPRTDMVTLPAAELTDVATDLVIEAGRSRVPVTGQGIDDIVGMIYARDLLKLLDDAVAPRPCRDAARKAYFVPETKPVLELLREMQTNQIHMAIVVDEFGGTAGLVTIEDLLEEIVGEIVDEYDDEEPLVIEESDGAFLVDGRLPIDELEELIGVVLPDEEWDTVGGLVLGLAGKVPSEGDSFELNGHEFVAARVQGRRISQVRLSAAR